MTSRVRRTSERHRVPTVHGLERSTIHMYFKAEGSAMFASRWINAGGSAVQWINNAGTVLPWV